MTVELSKARSIAAPADVVWAVLADFAAISRWAPNVDHSTPTTAALTGVGAVRRVQAGRITLLEEIVDWLPPLELAYRLIGLPPPAGTVITRWSLAEKDSATLVTVCTTISPVPGPPGRIVSQVLRRQFANAADAMLAGLAGHVQHSAAPLEDQR